MRKTDWLFAFFLISIGIVCMTVSAISFLDHPSESFVRTLLVICLWLGIPLFIIGSVYYLVRRKLNRKTK